MNSKVEALEHQLFLFRNARFGRKSEKDAESETITYARKKNTLGRQQLPQSLTYSEQIDIVPQMAFRVVHVRKKYACKQCEENIQVAKAPIQPIPQSVASWYVGPCH